MKKIAINPTRLQFCCNILGIDVTKLYNDIQISQSTINDAMAEKAAFSVHQLEMLAAFFNRSLLFFLNPNPVNEELVYFPQFRTIHNQKPTHSKKINALIERVELHRKVYLNLLKDLNMPIIQNLGITVNSTKPFEQVREWLGIRDNLSFNGLRKLVEGKGIMVFVSNGFAGKWQIEKSSPVRGFSLYYKTLPIIVIKKQTSEGAQAFTLMHELAHLLLHKESVLDEDEDFYNYNGKEKEANEFASNVLIPQNAINKINLEKLQNLDIEEHDSYLKNFKDLWCVSSDAILYRLFRDQKITKDHYQAYRALKKQQQIQREIEEENQKKLGTKRQIPRVYRHREPINIFGKPYVATVLDALQNQHITLSKASTHLDNLKIRSLHKLEAEFVYP